MQTFRLLSSSEQCVTTQLQPLEPLLSFNFSALLKGVVKADLFHWYKKGFMVIVDYNYMHPEVPTLSSTSRRSTNAGMKSVLARRGMSRLLSVVGPLWCVVGQANTVHHHLP